MGVARGPAAAHQAQHSHRPGAGRLISALVCEWCPRGTVRGSAVRRCQCQRRPHRLGPARTPVAVRQRPRHKHGSRGRHGRVTAVSRLGAAADGGQRTADSGQRVQTRERGCRQGGGGRRLLLLAPRGGLGVARREAELLAVVLLHVSVLPDAQPGARRREARRGAEGRVSSSGAGRGGAVRARGAGRARGASPRLLGHLLRGAQQLELRGRRVVARLRPPQHTRQALRARATAARP